ncbi:aldo/keto reductase [Streptomyces sp. TLI_146]|uniref:aldo/keto reductase n=1 Tax=Streptomyces sp. TLI_146 TaxID=1938858 RepID=UPI000C704630|nr:aldo/keto reductase [Streptomyces sp. TLI_146]PKV89416.1 aryl-alcohol dehydrogenase-like predicted oxidoreductase [Streptomyces sp. TLI_146]
MKRRQLGGADGFEVSGLCLGAMGFGTWVDERASYAILDRFLEAGGTFVDTADCYAFWVDGATGAESELLLGRWLADRGVRDEMVLATKVGGLATGPLQEWPGNAEGLSAPVIRKQAEASLRHLGTDRIDLYYAHVEDRTVPVEETVGAFGELVRDGKARALGCSNLAAWRIEQSRSAARELGVAAYGAVQQRLTYLRPRPGADGGVNPFAGPELLDYVRDRHDELTLLAYSPQLGGAYTNPAKPLPAEYDHPDSAARLAVLRAVADELGATVNQVVLAWLLHSDPAALPVVGASSVAQLDEALGALELDLDPELMERLDAAGA